MSSKIFWQLLNGITIALLALVMLLFFGIIPFDYTFVPLIFSIAFLIFFIIVQLYLANIFSTFLLFTIALLLSFGYDKVLEINDLYKYNLALFYFSNIPIAALFTWLAAILQAYHFQNGVLFALKLDKPILKKKEFSKLFILMFFDGLHLLTIGFVMEYLIVKNGFGTWLFESNFEVFELPVFLVWASYFIIGFFGSGIFRCYEFFINQAKLKPFNGYKNIFGLIYLVCFLISLYVLYDVNFSPIFAFISIVMLFAIVINDKINRKGKIK